MNRITQIALFISCCICGLAFGQNAEREADHEALRALRTSFVAAINEQQFDALRDLVHTNFSFVSSDNQKFTSIDALEDYWKGLFEGDAAVLDKLTINPQADDLTYFISPEVGLAQGSSDDQYHFKKLGARSMPSRWTAVVVKSGDAWKVSHVHMSADVTKNPIIDAHKKSRGIVGALAGVAGLVMGALLFRRRKSNTPA